MSYVAITTIPNKGRRRGRPASRLTAAFDAALASGQALETIDCPHPDQKKKQRDRLQKLAKRRGFKLASQVEKDSLFITYWGEK